MMDIRWGGSPEKKMIITIPKGIVMDYNILSRAGDYPEALKGPGIGFK